MKISNLVKTYESFSLFIDGLNLVPGRIYGLIGPNGCGKTTLMKLFAGLIKADGGVIDYEGLTQRDITMVPRKPYFLHDSVYRNLIYPLTLRGIKPDKELVDNYLETAGLQNKRRQYAPSLSSGEQQKLSLARALIFSPKIIMADEAFSNLDIESAGLFERIILDRQKSEPAVWLITSHQLSHISRLCSHTFFMYNGKIETMGTTSDILFKPVNLQLKKYLQYEKLHEVEDGIFTS